MNNSIFDILKLLNGQNSQKTNNQQAENPSFNYYPNEAFSHTQNINTSNNENNILPLLMSILGKNNDLSKIFSQSTNKKEEDIQAEKPSPKDEILL